MLIEVQSQLTTALQQRLELTDQLIEHCKSGTEPRVPATAEVRRLEKQRVLILASLDLLATEGRQMAACTAEALLRRAAAPRFSRSICQGDRQARDGGGQ